MDNEKRGGDIDLMPEFREPVERPAMLGALLSARLSRIMNERSVDILLMDPGLKTLPIHKLVLEKGVLL